MGILIKSREANNLLLDMLILGFLLGCAECCIMYSRIAL